MRGSESLKSFMGGGGGFDWLFLMSGRRRLGEGEEGPPGAAWRKGEEGETDSLSLAWRGGGSNVASCFIGVTRLTCKC